MYKCEERDTEKFYTMNGLSPKKVLLRARLDVTLYHHCTHASQHPIATAPEARDGQSSRQSTNLSFSPSVELDSPIDSLYVSVILTHFGEE